MKKVQQRKKTPIRNITQQGAIIYEEERCRLKDYKAMVIDALRKQTIFSVHQTRCHAAEELKKRGWLEKFLPESHKNLQMLPIESLLRQAKPGNNYEKVLISKIITELTEFTEFPAFLLWRPFTCYTQAYDICVLRNRLNRGDYLNYCSKVGLIGCAEQEHWYKQEGISEMSHPRFYRMEGRLQERTSFIDDYRRTQCRNLLNFIIKNKEDIIDEYGGAVPSSIISFALNNLTLQLMDFEHGFLDKDYQTYNKTIWKLFIQISLLIIQRKAKLKTSLVEITRDVNSASKLLRKLETKQPDYKWDGIQNIWILNPANLDAGSGIKIMSNLDAILKLTSKNSELNYIAQKYVECPLLIHNTKFDIRQYMLLTISNKMVRIYLYKDCYLKFSSQEFTLNNLSERVHLTNHSIQQKFTDHMQNPKIPPCLMWSLEDFQMYLENSNAPPNIWEEKIFPNFRRNVVSVILSNLEEMDFASNTFELTGCDFMLDEHYNPILIEVNPHPDMEPTTSVTERICPMVQQDVIKVLVDLPKNAQASIGQFQLVYELQHKIKSDFKPHTLDSIICKHMKLLSHPRNKKGRRKPYDAQHGTNILPKAKVF